MVVSFFPSVYVVVLWLLLLFVGAWNAVCNLLSQGIATRMSKFINVLACFRAAPDVSKD